MIYRMEMFFSGNGQGWGETHQLNNATTDPTTLKSLMQQWAQKRADFLGAPYAVIYTRASAYIDGLGNRAKRAVFGLKQVFTSSQPDTTGDAEPGDVALILRGNSTGQGTQNTTWLGAPPDAAISLGGVVSRNKAGLGASVDAYTAFLVSNAFGWGISDTPGDNKIASFTQNLDGTVVITLVNAAVNPSTATVNIPARIRQVNHGKSNLNGQCIVDITGAKTLQTHEAIAFAGLPIGGFIKLYKPLRGFTPYTSMDLELFVGEHRRGRPFGTSRARSPVRIRA